MRIPESIRPGDTIGLVAPSFGAVIEPYATRLQAAIRNFEARGYHVKAAESCYMGDGLGISTKPEKAAEDLMRFYLDDSVDALISVGGGELMNETISCIDFDRLREARPKWFMGYSDNTNCLMPMVMIADTAGIYGPCATGFGKPWEDTEKDAFAILEGTKKVFSGYPFYELPEAGDTARKDEPLAPYVLTEPKILSSYVPGEGGLKKAEEDETVTFSGIFMGGCLDVLVNLSGTKFDGMNRFNETHENVIWMLEACDLNPMAIRRSVWTLLNQGWFDHASGFLIGRPLASFREEMMGVDAYNAVTDVIGHLGVPVIMDADFGHVSPMLPAVIGAGTEVRARGNDLRMSVRF